MIAITAIVVSATLIQLIGVLPDTFPVYPLTMKR